MEYKKIGETYYIRMDRGDEIIGYILEICRKESIPSAIFSGIGGCSNAELQVFIPETGSFETEQLEGMLELVSLNGNVVSGDDGQLYHHTHALFSFKKDGQHGMAGGHLKSTTVLYTAEIELRPTIGAIPTAPENLRAIPASVSMEKVSCFPQYCAVSMTRPDESPT